MFKYITLKDITNLDVTTAMLKFQKEKGKFPNARSGEAETYFKREDIIDWKMVDLALKNGRRGLMKSSLKQISNELKALQKEELWFELVEMRFKRLVPL